MKKSLYILLTFFVATSCIKEDLSKKEHLTKEELDIKYHHLWTSQERNSANTAKNISYLSNEEKQVYYYLNLVRINPKKFADTYAKGYTGENGFTKGYAFDERKESLLKELSNLKPLPLIFPDKELYEYAYCFAYEGGKQGIMGHNRTSTGCKKGNFSECVQYGGGRNGLSITMSLLIDAGKNNGALGHRRICLKNVSYILGVSIQKHTKYEFNAVLDFKNRD